MRRERTNDDEWKTHPPRTQARRGKKKTKTKKAEQRRASPWRRDAFWTVTVDDDGDACVKNMN